MIENNETVIKQKWTNQAKSGTSGGLKIKIYTILNIQIQK